ncbi:MAG TPA: DUF4760 domain-containing protein [Candidatus Udaeobacter sp.]|jgi:hypothetical protein|nr:DUF4760 domain-containing protein [Candidatus Udaeobacter sp.]
MELSTLANLINALAVTAGVIFAAVQIREYRRQRNRDSMSALVRSFQTPSFAHSLRRVSSLPDDVAREQIPALLGPDGEDHIYALLTSWEALGILLYRKQVSIDLVDDFFSGPIVVTWRKLSRYIAELRKDAQRDTYFEWVQWLAERMMERENQTPPVPAHISHRNWK